MKKALQARLEAIQGHGVKVAGVFGAVGTALVSSAANAAIDVTEITGEITGQQANIGLIAIAVLSTLAVIAGVMYLRKVIH